MIDSVNQSISQTTVGIISSRDARDHYMFQKYLPTTNCLSLSENQQTIVDRIIKNIMSGKYLDTDIRQLSFITSGFAAQGATSVVIGCTELSLVSPQIVSPIPLLDTAKTVANYIFTHLFSHENS